MKNSSNKKLKIIIIISDKTVLFHINNFIEWAKKNNRITLKNIFVLNKNKKRIKKPNRINNFLFKFIFALESFFLKKIHPNKIKNSKINIDSDKLIFDLNEYNFKTNEIINSKTSADKIDLIINFSDYNFPLNISKKIKYGIFEFHENELSRIDNIINSNSFWGVINKLDKTEFKIFNVLKKKDLVLNGFIKTEIFISLNYFNILEKKIFYLKFILDKILKNEVFVRINKNSNSSKSNYRNSSIAIKYIFRLINYLIYKSLLKTFGFENRWGVAFINKNWNNADLSKGVKLDVRPLHYIADPFILSKDNNHYCFVEEYGYSEKKGWISLYKIFNNSSKYLGKVIEEKFHLSFPFIFRYNNSIYMCPESSQNSDIRLYKCIDFPFKWTLKSILLKNINAADTILFKKNRTWWMFTNVDSQKNGNNCSELHIYSSKSLFDNYWKPHSLNPIFIDSELSRNAGLLMKDNRMFRVAQSQGFGIYGKSISINEIITLDSNNYNEKCIKKIEPNFFKNIYGTHHLFSNENYTVYDYVSFSNKWL